MRTTKLFKSVIKYVRLQDERQAHKFDRDMTSIPLYALHVYIHATKVHLWQ